MTDNDPGETRQKWDNIYRNADYGEHEAVRVLTENRHLLPESGRALEVACGRGANALLLARHGLDVDAWDISAVVIEQLNTRAREQELAIRATVRDVVNEPPDVASYDVVVVSHFLDRALFPALRDALKPDGLLCYQTFTRSRVSDSGPGNPEYRLADNELLALCRGMQVLVYREEGRYGNVKQGLRDVAMIIASRR